MTKTTFTLPKRTGFQVQAAEAHLDHVLAGTTPTTVSFKAKPAFVLQAINEALGGSTPVSRGERTALHSIRRAVESVAGTGDDQAGRATSTPKKATPAKAASKPTAKKATAAKADRPATGPRGELLDRRGVVVDGYEVRLGFREFETRRSVEPTEGPRWLTVCVAHGSTKPAANGTEAERQGARQARATWCKACRKAGR